MWTTALHDDFGVEVHAVNLRTVTAENLYPDIRDLFEQYSLLLFRDQDLGESQHRALAELFGPLEDLRTPKRECHSLARWCRMLDRKANWSGRTISVCST